MIEQRTRYGMGTTVPVAYEQATEVRFIPPVAIVGVFRIATRGASGYHDIAHCVLHRV